MHKFQLNKNHLKWMRKKICSKFRMFGVMWSLWKQMLVKHLISTHNHILFHYLLLFLYMHLVWIASVKTYDSGVLVPLRYSNRQNIGWGSDSPAFFPFLPSRFGQTLQSLTWPWDLNPLSPLTRVKKRSHPDHPPNCKAPLVKRLLHESTKLFSFPAH